MLHATVRADSDGLHWRRCFRALSVKSSELVVPLTTAARARPSCSTSRGHWPLPPAAAAAVDPGGGVLRPPPYGWKAELLRRLQHTGTVCKACDVEGAGD
jgi:hypothetical protein